MQHPVEPWKIKMVERIRLPDPAERRARLMAAKYNPFRIPAHAVFIDLLTDSGTGAMSDKQWSALMSGDESYAGSRSFDELATTVAEITGYPHILPVHQGRGAENVLAMALVKSGDVIPANSHFDTTRANFEAVGARALDLLPAAHRDPASLLPFKGDIDPAALAEVIAEYPGRVPFIVLTLTNNAGGGQPVSLACVRAVSELARKHAVPLFIDAARYAENGWFIQQREPGQSGRAVRAIAREIFDRADGMWMSAKKDGLVNIGGLLCLRDTARFEACRERLILNEGFETYGGLAGRDLSAMAVGLEEALDEEYLAARIGQVGYLHAGLKAAGFPLIEPAGGHAVYLDAGTLLPHIPRDSFPGQSLMAALYLAGAVRGCEIGSLAFGGIDPATGKPRHPDHELLRLAVPRRVYTESHLAFVIERAESVRRAADKLPGFKLTLDPPRLRHFTCELEPLGPLPEFAV
jgi:tryptophanase